MRRKRKTDISAEHFSSCSVLRQRSTVKVLLRSYTLPTELLLYCMYYKKANRLLTSMKSPEKQQSRSSGSGSGSGSSDDDDVYIENNGKEDHDDDCCSSDAGDRSSEDLDAMLADMGACVLACMPRAVLCCIGCGV